MDAEDQFKLTCRLIIKNIPENISDEHFQSILNDNFAKFFKEMPLMIKLNKKYAMKKKNKICFFAVNSLEARAKVVDFFSTFELIDPKGMKHKLLVNDCLLQTKIKPNKDSIENTLGDCEHFLKFKEAFASDKVVDYKTREEEYCKTLFDGIEDLITPSRAKEDDVTITTSSSSAKPKGMVIMKKTNDNAPVIPNETLQYDIQDGNKKEEPQLAEPSPNKPQANTNPNCEIEIIQESNNKHYKGNNRGQKNKGNYNDNYNNNDGYYYSNGSSNKKGFQKGNSGGYYDNGYYYENNASGGSNKQGNRKGGYKKGYK